MKSNRELMERLNVQHVFEDPDDLSVVDQIKQIIQQEEQITLRLWLLLRMEN